MRTHANQSPSARFLPGNLSAAAICVLAAAMVCTWWVRSLHDTELNRAIQEYREESALQSQSRAESISQVFLDVYQGIRTIARLPGVRDPGVPDSRSRESARIAAQEIYN
ncbi:MAG TPA: hypothetical protein VK176_15810, partial [Phycisphaerales bacterium]|nr:hypothetical protein [Phycisphaerales bacterium]